MPLLTPSLTPLLSRVFRAFIMLLIAGGLIGLLHHQDGLIAIVLALLIPLLFWRVVKTQHYPQQKLIIAGGVLLTGLLGTAGEVWGVTYGHWAYHDLSGGRHFPYWLPFAWMLAFIFLYRLEASFISLLGLKTLKSKLILAATISTLLPTWGEIITINLGVWTYYWEYQLLGVPLLAIFLLMVFHTGIYLLFTAICQRWDINDPVFSIPKTDKKPQPQLEMAE